MQNHIKNKKEKERNGHIVWRYMTLLILCLSMSVTAFAQAKNIKGKIVDTNGEPITGASVVVNGTTKGTFTDIDGNFSIQAAPTDKLTISFLGYISQEIAVGNRTDISVQLQENATDLDEVVVTGYASQKKATLTGSVASVSNKELIVTKNENVVNMLTGKVPGLRITQRSAQPGTYNTVIDIRGMNDVVKDSNGNARRSTPLFVIDGISRDQDYFSRMSPDEIETVTVLKDAAAAVYGLRAANGVILVTTKRGTPNKNGKVDITYSGSFTLQQMANIPKTVTPLQWMDLRNEQYWSDFNQNYLNKRGELEPESNRQPWLDGTKKAYDWMGALFHELTPQTEHNVSIDGGTDRVSFFTTIGYSRQDGAYKSGDLYADKWNFRTNVDAKITDRLKASVQVGAILTNRHEPGADLWAVYKKALLTRPDGSFYANDNPEYLNGNSTYISEGDNLLAATNSDISGYRLYKERRLNGTLSLTYDIPGIKGLQAGASYDYAMSLPDNTNYRRAYNLYDYTVNDEGVPTYTAIAKNTPSQIMRSSSYQYDTDMQLKLMYANKFGQHNVNGVVVFEEAYSNYDAFSAQRDLMFNTQYLFAGEDLNQLAKGESPWDRLNQAFIGQFNYDYAGKYLVDFRFRYDGSSRYPKGARWGFFPSLSLGWRISEESFIKDKWSWMQNLKLRASYGEMGDDFAAGNYPPNVTGYEIDPNYRGWYFGNSLQYGLSPTEIPNLDLTWYKIKMINVGLDFDVFNSLLSGTVEWFRRNRSGLLATSANVIPGTVGAAMPEENLNDDANFGWELELMHRNNIGSVGYFVSGQFSTTRSERTKWVETPASNSFDYWKNRTDGRYNNIGFTRKSEGYFTNLNDIRNFSKYPMSQGALPGDWYFEDWNGDGIINDDDNHPMYMKGLAELNYGISVGANWNNFDLSADFQGTYGVYVQPAELFVEPLPFNGANTLTWFMDRWHPVDETADFFDPNTEWVEGYYPVTNHDGRRTGSNSYQNASYLRLKTLEIGYTIPSKITSQIGIKNLRVFLNAYNLFTITPLRYMDPERPSGGDDGLNGSVAVSDGGEPGYVGMYGYPNNKTYTVGASIKF